MNHWKKIVLITIGALAALMLFSWAVLPGLIRNKAVDLLKEATGRNAAIEKISLNPLTLTVQVRNLSLEEPGGGVFFSVENVRVSVSPASIYRRALVLSEASIASPSLSIVRDQPDHFNLSDILERQKKEEKPKKEGIFPLVIHNFHLDNGACDFEDRVITGGRSHSIKKLAISLPWLSTLPKEANREATPHISAIVNKAPLTLNGKTKPFSAGKASALFLTLQQLNLPELAAYLPQALPVDLASGKLTIDAEFLYRQAANGKPEVSLKGLARLDDLNINLLKGEPLLKLSSLEIAASRIEPVAGVFAVEKITLAGLELFVSRDRQGEWMVANMLKPGGEKKSPQASPSFSLASLALRNGRINFRDDLPREGFHGALENIQLDIKNAASSTGQVGQYNLSLHTDSGADLSSSGSFTIPEKAVDGSLNLSGLPLQTGWPYLSEYLTTPLKGVIDLTGEVAFNEKNGLTAEKGSLTVKNFSARYGNSEGMDLKRLAVTGAAFDQKSGRLDIERINLSGGNVSLSLEADGKISAQSLIKAKLNVHKPKKDETKRRPTKKDAAEEKPPAIQEAAAKPLQYHLKKLEIDKTTLAFTDLTRPLKPRFTLRETALSLSDIKGPAPHPAQLRFSAIFGTDATIRAVGSITPAPFLYRGNLQIGRLPIRDFEAYYPEALNFQLIGGILDTAMELHIAQPDRSPEVNFRGGAGVSFFHIVDAVEQEDLLKWQRLQLEGIDGSTRPFRLAIGKVSLNEPYARIIIREDGTLNLQEMIRKEPGGNPTAEAETPNPGTSETKAPNLPETPGQPKQEPPDVRMDNVTIADGTVSFTDKHLPNDFDTTFYKLGGRISGLTSEATLMADVDLRGNLENHSPLTIKGRINPLREDLFVDLKLSFTDIDLSPMSPYSETYLGYILKQGKLFLDLEYHIENKKLVSENRIMVDQFTFGDQVESDKATSLPVKLGIALLKDNRGEIHLDVPVTGRLDDPRFNIWRIVLQVVKNLLVKAVTAPFSLLSSLFGGGSDLSVVSFPPGSSVLQPAEEKKLESLAKGLNQRPSLKMSLSAYVDQDKDAEGYRNELLNRKLKREKMLALVRERQSRDGEDENTVDLSSEERSEYIRVLWGKEKFPKPRDASGREVVLPETEMVKLILANIKVEKDELENLAEERVDAALQYLINRGNIPTGRIFKQKDDIFKIPTKKETPPSRVEFNAITN
jgi:uncharacterized protein involved in outer membrane biogenesis